jgi:hypothetical protein
MAPPTLISVSPDVGHPTGGQATELIGTDFQLPFPPPPVGIPPPAVPSVRVLFGSTPSSRVWVTSDTRLLARVPKTLMPTTGSTTLGELVVDVTVENLDPNGVLIPGETFTLPDAYTYRRPDLSTAAQAPQNALNRRLLQLLKSEVIPDVLGVDTDFDSDPATWVIDPAKLPSLVLTLPGVSRSELYNTNEQQLVSVSGGTTARQRRSLYVDLNYPMLLIANKTMSMGNLVDLVTTVIDRNPEITFEPFPGTVLTLDLEWTDLPTPAKQTSQLRSNIQLARGSFTVAAFPQVLITGTALDSLQEFGATVDEIVLSPAEKLEDNGG